MWYSGNLLGIGYAWSQDGVVWTKHTGNPIIPRGPSSWEVGSASGASILGPDSVGGYKMWYQGADGSFNRFSIGYATSTDTITWTKYVGNPVFSPGTSGSWDDRRVQLPRILNKGQLYQMWYSGMRTDLNTDGRMGYANSPEGINWTRYPANPVLPAGPSSWDGVSIFVGDVLIVGNSYHMWYGGHDGSHIRIGYATAPPVSVREVSGRVPAAFELEQNYPNPFNPSTQIRFSLPRSRQVTLKIFNLLGQEVATLVSEELPAGSYSTRWDASGLASGVYLYRLQAGDPSTSSGQRFVETKKLLLVR